MPPSFRFLIRAAIVVLGLAAAPAPSAYAQATTLDSISLGADTVSLRIHSAPTYVLTLTLYGDPEVMRRCHMGGITHRWTKDHIEPDRFVPVAITYPQATTVAARQIRMVVHPAARPMTRQFWVTVAKGTCFAATQLRMVAVKLTR